MAKNLVSLQLSPEQMQDVDAAMATLERVFAGLVSLSAEDRRRLTKMGEKSELFCRQALVVLAGNPQIVPPSLDVDEAAADLKALDQLRPVIHRLARLTERATDTETALGADVMDAAMQGYALLKVAGKEQGLDGLRQELGSRWARSRRPAAEPDPA